MHRIDSATARANVNGNGKNGFHDNGDLPNQDATYFTPAWANAVQEEVCCVIEELGINLDKSNNRQLLTALVAQFGEKAVLENTIAVMDDKFSQQLARIEALENRTYEDTQIGELFWTTEHFATASQVSEYKGYGTWERALQGRVPVGFSDIASDPVEYRTHGAEYGSFEHQLTIAEMPSHRHDMGAEDGGASNVRYTPTSTEYADERHGVDTNDPAEMISPTGLSGDDKPHPNQPPSKTLDCWKRIA